MRLATTAVNAAITKAKSASSFSFLEIFEIDEPDEVTASAVTSTPSASRLPSQVKVFSSELSPCAGRFLISSRPSSDN